MASARKLTQHGDGIGRIGRLAQNAVIKRHSGIRAQDGRRRQLAPLPALHRRIGLGVRNPLHIGGR